MFPARTFAGKRVAVFGLARSGLAMLEALRLGGAQVLAWDDSPSSRDKVAADGVVLSDLNEVDFASLDSLILSPGVPLTHPEPHWTVSKARAAGVEIIGDTEVFAREIAGSGARMVAITGTNGKSTTTALTGHVLRAAGLDAHVGGNIGTAVFLLPPPGEGKVYVLELSSYQIDLMPGLAPDAGVLLNLSPDHLDRHGTMDNYAAVKARMFARQQAGQTAIVGVDDRWCRAIADAIGGGPAVRRLTVQGALDDGISAADGVIVDRRGGVEAARIDITGINALRGRHNWQNAGAAYGAAAALGVAPDVIAGGLASFPGLVHRMQEVGRAGRVRFVNDSKATNADAAARALDSFERIYWIAGGLAKDGGIDELAPFFGKIRKAYLIGKAATAFGKVLDGKVEHVDAGTMAEAVRLAAADAGRDDGGEPVVLLSPACASFDQYPNFEVRGDDFVAQVALLGATVAQDQEVA